MVGVWSSFSVVCVHIALAFSECYIAPHDDDAKRHEVMCLVPEVYFAPDYQDNVGMLDVVSKQFSTVATNGAAATGIYKYNGAAAVGTKVGLCGLSPLYDGRCVVRLLCGVCACCLGLL